MHYEMLILIVAVVVIILGAISIWLASLFDKGSKEGYPQKPADVGTVKPPPPK